MNLIERVGLAALHRCDPERAHALSLSALRMGLVPLPGAPVRMARLATRGSFITSVFAPSSGMPSFTACTLGSQMPLMNVP